MIKLLIELQKPEKLRNRIIQKQLHDKEILIERYISPEERQKLIDDLRLI